MKVTFTLCFSLISLFLGAQQEVRIDERLLAVYDAAYLERLQAENPFLLQRLNFYLDNAWYISDYPAEKGTLSFPVVQIGDPASFNILLLEKEQVLHRDFEKESAYSINGTRKVLIFRSGREFTRMLNEHLGRSYQQ
jgi:hypothetical protein